MTSLQTVALGLVIVFLDVPPDGFDWVADPVGWLLVVVGLAPLAGRLPNQTGLSITAWVCLAFSVVAWPAGSPATLTPLLGWLFSVPTLAWCFLVCDAVADATPARGRRWWMLGLRNVFAVAAVLPGLVHLGGQRWLTGPSEVLLLLANVALVVSLWVASGQPGLADDDADADHGRAGRSRRADAPQDDVPPPTPRPRARTVGFSAEEAKRRARRRREAGEAGSATAERSARKPAKQPTKRPSEAREPERTSTGPVTGAEVIERVRRRREAREAREAESGEHQRADGEDD